MVDYFAQIEFWHWWVLATLLITFEVVVPSTLLLWPGIGAAIVGLVVLTAGDIGWQIQLALFAVLSLLSVIAWRFYKKLRPDEPEPRMLNQRAQQIVGRRFTLGEAVVGGHGKLRIDDTLWKVQGDDLAAGTHVEVVEADGVVLKIERVA